LAAQITLLARSASPARRPNWRSSGWPGTCIPYHLVEVTYAKDKKELCTEGFGIGLMATLIKRRAKGKKADGADDMRRGRRALAALVSDAGPFDLEINIDGKPWKRDLISVDVLNIPFTGPALPLAHRADPGDRLLDVIGFESDCDRPHQDRL
jgi:diacylglycerol kinase family enzyme